MPVSDHLYINFSQDDELNYILKKYKKSQTKENRSILKEIGDACKQDSGAKMLKHAEFYPFLEKRLNRLQG